MPYDERESLKDQVGLLVGLFNSDVDGVVRLAKVQLAQMGKKVVPILLAVLYDMEKKKKTEKDRLDAFRAEEERRKKEDSYSIMHISSRKESEIRSEVGFNRRIVEETLDTLSYFSDVSLVNTFSRWLPLYVATKGLLRIGSKDAFEQVIPTITGLFDIEYIESDEYQAEENSIRSYLSDWELPYREIYEGNIKENYRELKLRVSDDIAELVDEGVLSEFISRFEKLSRGQKELVVNLISRLDSDRYKDMIIKWAETGSASDIMLLSYAIIHLGKPLGDDITKALFSKLIADSRIVASRGRPGFSLIGGEDDYVGSEELLEFLAGNSTTETNVDMILEVLAKKRNIEINDLPIARFIVARLQQHKEKTISYISRLLAKKDKNKVGSAAKLLSYLTEEAE